MNYIISPHIDDAFICLGGIFVNRYRQEPFRVLHIFTRTNSTTRNNISGQTYEKDEELVTQLRKNEERSIASILGHEYECWDFPDKPIRGAYTEDDMRQMEREITARITGTAGRDDTLYFPLGIMHTDHILINRIGIRLREEGYQVRFYEDMPYMVWDVTPMQERYKALTGAGLVPYCEQIDIDHKIDLLKNYGSQIRQDWFESLSAYAYNPGDNSYVERYWQ